MNASNNDYWVCGWLGFSLSGSCLGLPGEALSPPGESRCECGTLDPPPVTWALEIPLGPRCFDRGSMWLLTEFALFVRRKFEGTPYRAVTRCACCPLEGSCLLGDAYGDFHGAGHVHAHLEQLQEPDNHGGGSRPGLASVRALAGLELCETACRRVQPSRERLHDPPPGATDGEAALPGPRLRRRGPRSQMSRDRRLQRRKSAAADVAAQDAHASAEEVFAEHKLTMLHLNMRGYISHIAEVAAMIRLMHQKPIIVCLNETFLTRVVEEVELEGYQVLVRRDRIDQWGGGVLVFVLQEFAAHVTLMEISDDAERVWAVVHSDQGPYLLCSWYRPPRPGEVDTIKTFVKEWIRLRVDALGTFVLGDLNLHMKRWLRYSSEDTPEGKLMMEEAQRGGLKQLVAEPTRGANLLDIVLTDVGDAKAFVAAAVSDHKAVVTEVSLSMPKTEEHSRLVWKYREADWELLVDLLENAQWDIMCDMKPDECAEFFTVHVLQLAEQCIPREHKKFVKSTHPWLSERAVSAVQAKHLAQGKADEHEKSQQCSKILLDEFHEHVQRSRHKLANESRISKGWWSKVRQFMQLKGKTSSIPALKENKEWILDPVSKANCFADTFRRKNEMIGIEENEYTHIPTEKDTAEDVEVPPLESAVKILQGLDESSGTGPDLIPTKILRRCAGALALPIWFLASSILRFGHWPTIWKEHWLTPLYKKRSVYNANNYRGIHLTSQVSKVLERFLGLTFIPYLHGITAFGPNQFAYLPKCGARDALAHVVLTWISGFGEGLKFCIYCSDVSGAFDKVNVKRLLKKLCAKGVPANIIRVIESWLGHRKAHVVVAGCKSKTMTLENMVYQGTVWGPALWNVHYADASVPIQKHGFTEIIFADDLNAYKAYKHDCSNDVLLKDMQACQEEVHKWGRGNQVTFDKSKESMHIIGTCGSGSGGSFKQLGVTFDSALSMGDCVHDVVRESRWKLKTIIRAAKYFFDSELVHLYKARVLSFIEYRTPAIFHACSSHLEALDKIQD